jgi:hypothetical protein
MNREQNSFQICQAQRSEADMPFCQAGKHYDWRGIDAPRKCIRRRKRRHASALIDFSQ